MKYLIVNRLIGTETSWLAEAKLRLGKFKIVEENETDYIYLVDNTRIYVPKNRVGDKDCFYSIKYLGLKYGTY